MINWADLYIKLYKNSIYILISYISLLSLLFKYSEINKLGDDDRYFDWIILPSIILGLTTQNIAYYLYIKKIAHEEYSVLKIYSKIYKFLVSFFLYGFIVTMFIYFMLFNIANSIWLKDTAEKHSFEIIECQVTEFFKGTDKIDPCVRFRFKNLDEEIELDKNEIEEFISKNPKDYYLRLLTRKTDWNYYLLEDWAMEKKSDSIESD